MEKLIDKDTMFGRLKVIERTDDKKHNCYLYKCLCTNCNKIVNIRSDRLRNGEAQSCGCIHDELLREKVKKAYKNNFKDGTSLPKLKSTKPQKNNTSGVLGVSWHKASNKWCTRISFKGKSYSLGYYDDIDDAKQAREIAKKELHEKYLNELK